MRSVQCDDVSQANGFDNMRVDVIDLYRRFPLERMPELGPMRASKRKSKFPANFYTNTLIPVRWRCRLHKMFRQTHVDLSWFETFRIYWSKVLSGRPLWGVEDFYYLKNVYRTRFQSVEIPDSDNANHVSVWQRPEVIYQLFHMVYKESLGQEIDKIQRLMHYHRGAVQSIVEFGCGTAPITQTFFDFFPKHANRVSINICDIQTLALHYAAFRLSHNSNVHPQLLEPGTDFKLRLPLPVDAIFCSTVFEHLNAPMQVVQRFHELLNRGGLLIFDYVKSKGDGLDTKRAVDERNMALDFIGHEFDILDGALSNEKSVKLTVARKR